MELNAEFKNKWVSDHLSTLATVIFFSFIILIIILLYIIFDLKGLRSAPEVSMKEVVVTQSPVVPAATPSAPTPNVEAQATGPQLQISSNDPKTTEIINRVFKHVFLPSGDVQVQTVVGNIEELKKINPVFYEFAKIGDHVLIYPDRAVLYDPVADRVLDIIHSTK